MSCDLLGSCFYRSDHPSEGPAFILPSPLPSPPKKIKMPATPPSREATPEKKSLSKKRAAPDDDDLPSAKRAKTNGDPRSRPDVPFTPKKQRKLDEDGLLMMESLDEEMGDDDVIVID